MAHPLDGSRVRIERAGDHLEALDALLVRYVKDGGLRFTGERDPDTGEHVLRVYSNLQPPVPPPMRASAIVGDILNNLRSALDYIIWQLAAAPSRKNQFPICDTPELFEEKRPRHLSTVPERHWTKIEAYQPYPGREANRALAVLARLNDADKHHLLLPGTAVLAGHKGRFSGYGVNSLTIKGKGWMAFEEGAEVYRMAIEAAGGPVKVDAEVPHAIQFRDPDKPDSGVTIADLRIIRVIIANVVESFAEDFPA